MTASSDILQEGYAGDLTTLSELQLLCRFSNRVAADYCGVSPETYRRWRSDRTPTVAAVRLLAVRAGAVPWPDWHGWEHHSGYLVPPGMDRGGFRPGEIMALSYLYALIAEQKREISALRLRVSGAAPEARAGHSR